MKFSWDRAAPTRLTFRFCRHEHRGVLAPGHPKFRHCFLRGSGHNQLPAAVALHRIQSYHRPDYVRYRHVAGCRCAMGRCDSQAAADRADVAVNLRPRWLRPQERAQHQARGPRMRRSSRCGRHANDHPGAARVHDDLRRHRVRQAVNLRHGCCRADQQLIVSAQPRSSATRSRDHPAQQKHHASNRGAGPLRHSECGSGD